MQRGGDSVNLEQQNSKTRRGRVGRQMAQTLTTSCNQGVVVEVIGGIGDDLWGKQYPSGRRIYNPNALCGCITAEGGGLGGNSGLFLLNEIGGSKMAKQLDKINYTGETIKIFESFSGVGMQRMAFDKLGVAYESVGTSEIDIPAILSYASIHDGLLDPDEGFEYPNKEEMLKYLTERNIGLDFKTGKLKLPKNEEKIKQLYRAVVISKCYGDVCLLDKEKLPDMDLFTYSYPCQSISISGKREGMERGQTRSGLLYECEKVIEAKKPKYLLLENVKNLVGKQFKPQFDEWLEYLESQGYTNYWKVMNSKNYGVPQNRERVFVLSILGEHEKYEFNEGFELDIRLKDILEEEVDEKYYINRDFKLVDKGLVKGEFLDGNFDQTKRIHGVDSHFQTLGAADRGTNNIMIKTNLTGINYKQTSAMLDDNGICRTLDTMQGGQREPKILPENEYRVRKLTPRECWRLMAITDENFDKAQQVNSNSQLYKQAGNGIVVDVIYYIMKNLFEN